jgi:hypothetical protein
MSKVYALKQFKQTPEHKKVCFKAAVQRKTETKKNKFIYEGKKELKDECNIKFHNA